mgnify:CR=1 FL=1
MEKVLVVYYESGDKASATETTIDELEAVRVLSEVATRQEIGVEIPFEDLPRAIEYEAFMRKRASLIEWLRGGGEKPTGRIYFSSAHDYLVAEAVRFAREFPNDLPVVITKTAPPSVDAYGVLFMTIADITEKLPN